MPSFPSLSRLALLAGLLLAGPVRAADNVVLQLDWVPGGIAAPFFYGLVQNCYADQGIALKITRGFGAGDAITKVASGSSQFGITDLAAMIAGRAKSGAPVKAIVPIVPVSPFAVAVMDTSPVQTLKDLEGRKVASAAGDAGMAFLPIGMQLEGADFAKINKMSVEPAALVGLLIQGRIDAMTSYVTSAIGVNEAAKQVGRSVRVIPFGQKLDIYNASVFTSDAVIAANPGLVSRFAKATICSFDKARANPDASIDALVEQVTGIQRESQAILVPFSYKLAFDNETFARHGYSWDMARVAHTVEIVRQAQGIEAALDPASFVTTP